MLLPTDEELIQEIGELFGRFKTDAGQYVSFASRIGPREAGNRSFLNFYTLDEAPKKQFQFKSPFLDGPIMKKYNYQHYYGWQKKVVDDLTAGKDIYIVAPPGGGKTMPLMGYWLINIFLGGSRGDIGSLSPQEVVDSNRVNFNVIQPWSNIFYALLHQKYRDGKEIPKVLFITPIRVLAYEQAEGFQEIILDLLLFLKSLFMYLSDDDLRKRNPKVPINDVNNPNYWIDKDLPEIIQDFKNSGSTVKLILANVFENDPQNFDIFKIKDTDKDNITKFENLARRISHNFICVMTGGSSSDGYSTRPERSPIIIATYGSAKNFIKQIMHNVKLIVYDEAHLYQPLNEAGPSVGEKAAASDAYRIIEAVAGAPSQVQIVFLSGTIHPESAKNFTQYLNKKFHRDFKVDATVKGDPEAVNKTKLRVIPDDSLLDDDSIVRMASRWISNQETGNAIIMFSKAKIDRLVQKIMKRVAPSNLNDISNRGKINRVEMEDLKRYERALKVMNPDISTAELEVEMNKYKQERFPSKQSDRIEKLKNKPGATQIENSELRTAVAYGIGYIYTKDDKDISNEDRALGKQAIKESDKRIVADLFSNRKINVLIATPSIGVGVNVSIKNMYIPTIEKTEGVGFDVKIVENNKREMSQLLNRAGRGSTPISGIYTPQRFVKYIEDITLMGNEDHPIVQAIPYDYFESHTGEEIMMMMGKSVGQSAIDAYKKTHEFANTNSMLRFRNWMRQAVSQRIRFFQNDKQTERNIYQMVENISNKVEQDMERAKHLIDTAQQIETTTKDEQKILNFATDLRTRTLISQKLIDSTQELTKIRNGIPPNINGRDVLVTEIDNLRIEIQIRLTDYSAAILNFLIIRTQLIADVLDALSKNQHNLSAAQKQHVAQLNLQLISALKSFDVQISRAGIPPGFLAQVKRSEINKRVQDLLSITNSDIQELNKHLNHLRQNGINVNDPRFRAMIELRKSLFAYERTLIDNIRKIAKLNLPQ